MKVFISHARNDTILARAVYKKLQKYGYKVVSAETIEVGTEIQRAVESALNECQAMIVLLKPHSYQSPWVKLEVEHALSDENYKDRLLPVLVGKNFDSAPQKTPWILTALHHIILPQTDNVEANAKKVVDAFQQIVKSGETS